MPPQPPTLATCPHANSREGDGREGQTAERGMGTANGPVAEKRERLALLERELAALEGSETQLSEPALPCLDAVDRLQAALRDKQRMMQALRLRSQFPSTHELQLEANQLIARAVELQRKLIVRAPDRSHDLKAKSTLCSALQAARNEAESDAAGFGKQSGRGDAAIDEISEMAEALSSAVESLAPSLARVEAQMARPSGPVVDFAADEQSLVQSLELKKANMQKELARLKTGGGAGTPSPLDEGIAALNEEVRRLRDERQRLASGGSLVLAH